MIGTCHYELVADRDHDHIMYFTYIMTFNVTVIEHAAQYHNQESNIPLQQSTPPQHRSPPTS